MGRGKDRAGGEPRQLNRIKTAVKVEKRRSRAQATAEKKASAVRPASPPETAPPATPLQSAPAFPASAPAPAPQPVLAQGFPAFMPPALAALAPSLANLASAQEADAGAPRPDFERIIYNMARLVEQSGKALAASLKPPENNEPASDLSNEVRDAARAIGKVAEHWLTDPAKAVEAQTVLAASFMGLWTNALRRLAGETAPPFVPHDPADKRFAAPEWRDSPIFDFLRQAHVIAVNWANGIVDRTEELAPHDRDKAKFYMRQIASAMAPSNFFATNPEVLRETIESGGENLVRGASMLAQDLEAGHGRLKITRYDASKFALGVNLAMTPGKVVFRNDLIELIQYAPTTETVYKRPLLIVPPWINKFYILDLNPEKSFVRYAVSQGLTVFIVSWVNPDSLHRDKGFEDYMREGIFAALDAIEKATGEKTITAIGYCIGGTLLAMTLALMAERGDKRIESASFFTTQTDFSQAGDLKVFVDEDHLRDLELKMAQNGYLEATSMATSFNMLRPEDLIWSFVINNYLRGKPPLAFDLLAWNSDATRMTQANHLAYLRGCYLENRLARGKWEMDGKPLRLEKITIPVYHLATREDHIAPARSVFIGAQLVSGAVRYVLAGSGHIAGVINPVAKPKYQYWTGPSPSGAFDDWLKQAQEHKGSWWPDWIAWLTAQSPERAPARVPGDGALPALCEAPGEYVKVRY